VISRSVLEIGGYPQYGHISKSSYDLMPGIFRIMKHRFGIARINISQVRCFTSEFMAVTGAIFLAAAAVPGLVRAGKSTRVYEKAER